MPHPSPETQLRHPISIPIPEPVGPGSERRFYVGGRRRRATATSVCFVDARTIVCFSLLGRRGHVVRFDPSTAESQVIDTFDTCYRDESTETDLCDLRDDLIVTSNFFGRSTSLYRWFRSPDGVRVRFERDLPFAAADHVHGARFYASDVVVATARNRAIGAHFFHVDSGEVLLRLLPAARAGGALPQDVKDVAFVSPGRAMLLCGHGAPTREERGIFGCEIQRVDFDLAAGTFETTARIDLPGTAVDAVATSGGRLYVTDQLNDAVIVLDAGLLEPVEIRRGYDFPHGIAVGHGMLAVTNYGTSTVDVAPL